MRRTKGRTRFVDSYLVLGLSLAVVAIGLASPAAALTAGTRKIVAPYAHASTIEQHWANHSKSSGSIGVASAPRANVTTAGVAMSVSVNQGGPGTRSYTGVIGFEITFRVATNASHTVSANWSIEWNASASGTPPTGCHLRCVPPGIGSVQGTAISALLDRTNHTVVATASQLFLNLVAASTSPFASNGDLTLTLTVSDALVRGHSYALDTYLRFVVEADVLNLVTATATADLHVPVHDGPTLSSVSIS